MPITRIRRANMLRRQTSSLWTAAGVGLLAALLPVVAYADDPTATQAAGIGADTVWVVVAACFVSMKMVVAIIRHEKLQEVQDVLDECGVSGVTVTEVKGCGAQRGCPEKYRGAAVHISLRPRLKVEAVCRPR